MGSNRRTKTPVDPGAISGRLVPALTRWIKAERVGAVGLAVLVVTAALAGLLAIHGYRSHGLALAPIAPSTARSARSQPPPSTTSTTSKGAPARSTGASTSSTTSPPAKLGPALSSTQYASYAYRIYPGPVSASTQQAMAGYNISTKLSGSKVVVAVSGVGSSQAPSRRSYPAVDNVYFIEANFGDDSGVTELDASDDGLVVTNPQGLIVEG